MPTNDYARAPVQVQFIAGQAGGWRIQSIRAVAGEGLAHAPRLDFRIGMNQPGSAAWVLRGATSSARYTTRLEMNSLGARQDPLGRHEAVCAALIPIRKNAAWWSLAQDERREIYEERSRHTSIGMEYLPRIARQLHHSRDLGEPFDFLTWFEFAPEHSAAFDELLARLRISEEWSYVEREVEVRVLREG